MSEFTLVPCEVWGLWPFICMVIAKDFQGLDLEGKGLSSVLTLQTLLVQVTTPRRLWTAWSHLILPWVVFLLMLSGSDCSHKWLCEQCRPHGTALLSLLNLPNHYISERTGGHSVSKEANPGSRNGEGETFFVAGLCLKGRCWDHV